MSHVVDDELLRKASETGETVYTEIEGLTAEELEIYKYQFAFGETKEEKAESRIWWHKLKDGRFPPCTKEELIAKRNAFLYNSSSDCVSVSEEQNGNVRSRTRNEYEQQSPIGDAVIEDGHSDRLKSIRYHVEDDRHDTSV